MYSDVIVPVYLATVTLFDFSRLAIPPVEFIISKYPPGLVIPAKLSGFPIADILKGELNFTPFTVITEPIQSIALFVLTHCIFSRI